jgi:hypothetical protein
LSWAIQDQRDKEQLVMTIQSTNQHDEPTPQLQRLPSAPAWWPTVVWTAIFNIFGAGSAYGRAKKARAVGQTGKRYWLAWAAIMMAWFVVSVMASATSDVSTTPTARPAGLPSLNEAHAPAPPLPAQQPATLHAPAPETTAAVPTTAYNGAAALLKSAEPLHAHLGGPEGNSIFCDDDIATATNDGHGGVQVMLNFAGPANVQASALATDGQSQDIPYTESMQENGHVFDFPGYDLSQLQTLDVSVTSGAGAGTCWLVDNMH